MKRRVISLILAVVLIASTLPIAGSAATPRMVVVIPSLRIDGTTAHCEAAVNADYASDEITATIKLWNGSSCVATWYKIAYGGLSFYATRTVNLNSTYKLTVDATVNGVSYPTAFIEQNS